MVCVNNTTQSSCNGTQAEIDSVAQDRDDAQSLVQSLRSGRAEDRAGYLRDLQDL